MFFNQPLGKHLDFNVDHDGRATFHPWDGRRMLTLRTEEFIDLFQLLDENRELFRAEIEKLKQQHNQ